MRQLAKVFVVIGFLSLVVAALSRIFIEPIWGIESHAFGAFAQACFLCAIAGFQWHHHAK
jgi:hypothetical protein